MTVQQHDESVAQLIARLPVDQQEQAWLEFSAFGRAVIETLPDGTARLVDQEEATICSECGRFGGIHQPWCKVGSADGQ